MEAGVLEAESKVVLEARAAIRAAPLVLALCLSLACGKTTHTVGQVRPARNDDSNAPRAIDAGEDTGSAATAGSGAAGTSSGPSEDAGISAFPPVYGDAAVDWDAALVCGAVGLAAVRRRLDLYLIVDNNFTIQLPPGPIVAWDNLLRGLDSYVEQDDAAGTAVGVKYFGTQCTAGAYARPDVEVLPLPDNTQAIQRSLAAVPIINASPMVYALQGALEHSRSRANWFPHTKQAVVVITDGYAFGCQPADTSAPAVAADGVDGAPSIPTYVIALDLPELVDILPLGRLDSLDDIAEQGGTGQARRIDLQDSTDAFVGAMLDVQRDAETCDYAVPQLVRDEPGRLSLGVSDPNGLPKALAPLASSSECGDGFHMDAQAAWATLCPSVCDQIKQSRAELVWFTDC
jgi:hypothetical protein